MAGEATEDLFFTGGKRMSNIESPTFSFYYMYSTYAITDFSKGAY
jgi:hypothetical protein